MARVAKVVNPAELQKVITDLEAANTFESLGKLWEAVRDSEWGQKIGASTTFFIKIAKDNNLVVNTVASTVRGAKVRIEIDLNEFQETINQLEEENEFETQGQLWEAVKNSPFGQKVGASASYFYNAFRDNNLTIKTGSAKGKRRSLSTSSSDEPCASRDEEEVINTALLHRVFNKHGITITGITSMLTSAHFSEEQNKTVRLAWLEIRQILGVPAPSRRIKKE